jgi:hypothetical protein
LRTLRIFLQPLHPATMPTLCAPQHSSLEPQAGRPAPAVLKLLNMLPQGAVVVQHDDGSLEIYPDLPSAEASLDAATDDRA